MMSSSMIDVTCLMKIWRKTALNSMLVTKVMTYQTRVATLRVVTHQESQKKTNQNECRIDVRGNQLLVAWARVVVVAVEARVDPTVTQDTLTT